MAAGLVTEPFDRVRRRLVLYAADLIGVLAVVS